MALLLILSLVGWAEDWLPPDPMKVDTVWARDTAAYSKADVVQDSWRVPSALEAMVAQAYADGYNAAVVLANEKLAEAKARHIADLRAIKAQLDEIRAGLNPPRTAIRGESKVRFYPVAPPRWPYQEWRGSE